MSEIKLSELAHQKEYFKWVRDMAKVDDRFWMIRSDANAAKRSFKLASALKASGLSPGFPDISILVPRESFCGAFIELKKDRKSKASETQEWWLSNLSRYGYVSKVCYGSEEAIQFTKQYLGVK